MAGDVEEGDIASLYTICIASAAAGKVWSKQRRSMHRLPPCAANTLLRLLLDSGQLNRPHQLELFANCADTLHITRVSPQCDIVDGTWMAYVQELRHLCSLTLEACPKLRDTHLTGLWHAGAHLTSLSLSHCPTLTTSCLHSLAQLTRLQTLDITGCSGFLSSLPVSLLPSSLTELHVGDLSPSFDDESAGALPSALPHLVKLVAWGTALTTLGVQLLGFCSELKHLDVSWTQVDQLPAIHTLTTLDMQQCTIQGIWWPCSDPSSSPSLNLTHLNLSQSTLAAQSGVPHQLHQLLQAAAPRLARLDLTAVNQLVDWGFLEHARQLQHLKIYGPTRGMNTRAVGQAAALQQLSVRGWDLSEEGECWCLLGLTQIKRLELVDCQLQDASLPVLWQLTSLESLVLDGCPITGVAVQDSVPQGEGDREGEEGNGHARTAADPMDIWGRDVRDVNDGTGGRGEGENDVEGKGREGEGPSWGSLVRLSELSVIRSALTDRGLEGVVSGARRLKRLRVGSDQLSDMGMRAASMVDGVSVEELELMSCGRLTSRGIAHLRRWSHLISLKVSNCRLVRPIDLMDQLLTSSTLTSLHIDHQHLQRPSPKARTWHDNNLSSSTTTTTTATIPITPPSSATSFTSRTTSSNIRAAVISPSSTRNAANTPWSAPTGMSKSMQSGWGGGAGRLSQSPAAAASVGSVGSGSWRPSWRAEASVGSTAQVTTSVSQPVRKQQTGVSPTTSRRASGAPSYAATVAVVHTSDVYDENVVDQRLKYTRAEMILVRNWLVTQPRSDAVRGRGGGPQEQLGIEWLNDAHEMGLAAEHAVMV